MKCLCLLLNVTESIHHGETKHSMGVFFLNEMKHVSTLESLRNQVFTGFLELYKHD